MLKSLAVFATLSIWVPQNWPIRLFELVAFVLAGVWTGRWLLSPFQLHGHSILIALTGVVLLAWFQLATGKTECRNDTWNAALYWSSLLSVLALSVQVFRGRGRSRLLTFAVWFAGVLSVVSVAQYCSSPDRILWLFRGEYPDMFGPFQNQNNFACFAELWIPITLWKGLTEPKSSVYLVLAGALEAAVVSSASRAGNILAMLEIGIVVGLAVSRRGLLTIRPTSALLRFFGLMAVFSALVGWGTLRDRFRAEDPYMVRREILESALAMFKDRPWSGFGMGTFQTVYPAYASFDKGVVVNHAHNDWAEWAAEGGVPALAMWLGAIALILRPAIRSGWGIGVLAVAVHATVDYPFQRLGVAVWFLLVVAAVLQQNDSGPISKEKRGKDGSPV